MNMSENLTEDDGFLGFKEFEDQIAQFLNKNEVDEMLKVQLEEVEMLQSMFSIPGEFQIFDHSVIADINEFLEGKSDTLPPRIDFTIHLVVDDKKLEVNVNLPLNYPMIEPDIFVRNDLLSRDQQHTLNNDLYHYISSLTKGEICIYSAISWLQENCCNYFISKVKVPKIKLHKTNNNLTTQFARYWIYSHHIYSKFKRKCIIDLAQEFNVTGFCLPGRPGIICVEGLESDCSEWWQRIRCMNWKKIICKKKEEECLTQDKTVDSLRKFVTFQEISFDSGKNKSRECHMDMGEFYKYLSHHNCSYIFKEYFGVEGKISDNK